MSDQALDNFERYYTEKLWDWIPAVYRNADPENHHVLRALIQVIAERVAESRRSVDRLWENQAIESCDDWAVPLIGALVGTRLVPALNSRGRRVDVAKTIHYRRRSGTLDVLDQLLVDIAGWDGIVVEAFRRLGRARHGLDPAPGASGRFTATPSGGIADIRQSRGVELGYSPWDEFSHAPDLRRHRGLDGRYGIHRLNYHLARMTPYAVEGDSTGRGATPYRIAAGQYTFDPSGRDIPLYIASDRPEDCVRRQEEQVAGPLRCRLLGHAPYLITQEVLDALEGLLDVESFNYLSQHLGQRFADEARLRATLDTFGGNILDSSNIKLLLKLALVDDAAKHYLVGEHQAHEIRLDGALVPTEESSAGNLSNWLGALPTDKSLVVDPVRGRFQVPNTIVDVRVARYLYGFSGPIGAGTYDRRASLLTAEDGFFASGIFLVPGGGWQNVYSFRDNYTYIVDDVTTFSNLTFQAANLAQGGDDRLRPYLRRAVAEGSSWLFTPHDPDAELTLEGLWIGGGPLVLVGDFAKVTIRHCTLDPGGLRADDSTLDPALLIIRDGTIRELIIESSIINGISRELSGEVLQLTIRDSIASSTDPTASIDLPFTALNIERTTLDLPLRGLRIDADALLATKPVIVSDTQHGCIRYSVIGEGSQAPPIYSGTVKGIVDANFISHRFGDPGFFVLAEEIDPLLAEGAENGSELGGYSSLLWPVKLSSLRSKIAEFIPIGRIPALIREN